MKVNGPLNLKDPLELDQEEMKMIVGKSKKYCMQIKMLMMIFHSSMDDIYLPVFMGAVIPNNTYWCSDF